MLSSKLGYDNDKMKLGVAGVGRNNERSKCEEMQKERKYLFLKVSVLISLISDMPPSTSRLRYQTDFWTWTKCQGLAPPPSQVGLVLQYLQDRLSPLLGE